MSIEVEYRIEPKSPEEIREFIQRRTYEEYLRKLLIASKLFPGDLVTVVDQSNGEYDYFSLSTGTYYEVTLFASKHIMAGLAVDANYMANPEFSRWAYNDTKDVLIERLSKKSQKSIIVIFNIFPIVNAQIEGGVFAQFALDDWDLIIKEISQSYGELLNGKEVYLVSYNGDGRFYHKHLWPREVRRIFQEYSTDSDIFPFKSSIVGSREIFT